MKRRDVIIVGGLAALAGGWQVWGVRGPQIDWREIRGLPGWRFGVVGAVSGAVDPVLAAIPGEGRPAPLPPGEIEAALWRGEDVELAVFGDHFCPYCRLLFGRLAGSGWRIAWHELPLLRPESHIAARAAEAARLQGGYVAFQRALIEAGFRPGPSWLGQVAERAGLDGARLRRDMAGAEVAAGLLRSARAAETLGIFATPGVVAGRSVVLGAVSDDVIVEILNG
jgi:protein-disulfide isomerase